MIYELLSVEVLCLFFFGRLGRFNGGGLFLLRLSPGRKEIFCFGCSPDRREIFIALSIWASEFFFLIIRAGIYGLLKCQNKTPSKKQTFRSESSSAKLFNFLLESSPEKKKHRARASREPHKVVNLCTENQNRQKLMGNKQVVKIITNSFYICGRLEGVGLRVAEGKKEPRQQTECGQGCPGCPVQISWVSSTCDIVLVEVRSRV